MARKDFVPDSYRNLHDWSAIYSDGVGAVAARIGWPTASLTLLKTQLDNVKAATQAVLDAQHALDTVVGQLVTLKTPALAVIRAETRSLKATHGFTEGDAKALGIHTTSETLNRSTYQPILEAAMRHGYVELMAKKQGADSLNLYWRPEGSATWHLLAAKRVRFPFHDETPIPDGGTLQSREYMAIGVIGDEEIGNPSNIATAVFQA